MTEKVHVGMGGDATIVEDGGVIQVKSGGRIHIESGGVLNLAAGAAIKADGTQGAALTAQLTTITHTAPSTPDYALQDLVQNTGFGFATADEGNSVLKVIANLQVRLAEVEARFEAAALVVAN
jgi:hypothetical protein